MKYFATIFVWHTVVFLHIILTLNVEKVRTQHLLNGVKKTKFCYDKGIQGFRLKSEILKTLKTITEMLCVVRCVIDPCCRSVNFKRNSPSEGYGDCELLHDVENSTSSEMEEVEMYEHIPLLEPRKKYMICCKVCNGSGTHKPDNGTCYCTPTDGSSAYEKDIDNCISNPCHAKATCQNSGNSFVCVCKKGYVGISALTNVALNKVTKQSSTYVHGNADLAVDGNKNTYFYSESCTHTRTTTSPWWMVDLGQEYTVHHLTITNRGDCCHERLSNFEIRIGNFQANNTDQNPQCGGYYSLGAGETKKIVCPAQMKGRYVVIRIPGNNKTLTLCEVEVYVEYIVKECIPPTSCKEMAFRSNSSLTDGIYEIQLHETSENYSAYCHMSELGQCGGGGWSLVMKIDGNKDTFNYNSHFWLDKETYQVPQGLNGLTQEESKLASYWNTPFTKICLGMKVNGATKWVKMNYQASSLHNVIADGVFQPTSFGRATWLSLIDGSGLQQNCNEEGFNVDLSHVEMRLGIAGNDQNDCNTCDSFIGFGNYWKNELRACGAQNKNAFGYILVQ